MTGMSAWRRGATNRRILLAIIALGVIFYVRRSANRTRFEEPSAADTGKFVPAGDEGLGASIALLLDVSGSMSSAAKGDSRPKYIVAREALKAMLDDVTAGSRPAAPGGASDH